MRYRTSLAFVLAFTLALQSTFAQQPTTPAQPTPAPSPTSGTPQPTPPPAQQGAASGQDDDDVVRITTNLVQVDAVVTDRQGRQVTDLRAEDFEILENGRPQAITNFSYVALAPATSPTAPAVAAAARSNERGAPPVPPVPPARLRPEQVRRTYALVVDDLGLSFASTYFVQRALRKFVDEQMQPGDLVAIIRTGAGSGALQQFTSDRRQLYAAIDRVRWNMAGRGGISAFAPIEGGPLSESNSGLASGNIGNDTRTIEEENSLRTEAIDDFREEIFSVGTLGALNFVVRGMRELPGRKAVILFSDGFRILSPSGRNERVIEALRRLTDLANRASVVFYTIDPRGLQTLSLTAADNTWDLNTEQIEARLSARRMAFFESQSGLIYLAQQTGGLAVRNNNDIGGGIRRALQDQSGYYLIGYRPEEATFNQTAGRRRFNRVEVRLKRSGLRVRSRTGFYGISDEEARPVRRTRVEQLAAALTSPFATAGVHLRLTSLFANEAQAGSFMRSFLHIEARDLTFVPENDGWQRAVVDVVALTFGDSGRIVDEVNRTETIRVRGATYRAILQHGFIYTINVPVRQAGGYQMRVAVRDAATERTGSANQFIEVPNLRRDRLTLSGLVAVGSSPTPAPSAPAQASADESAMVQALNVQSSVAVRRFRSGMFLDYGYAIYNARLDRTSRRPQLTTQVRLFRDGQEVFAGQSQPFDASGQTDMERLTVGGRLRLGTELPPSEYVLQVVVTDALVRNERQRTATQWIDFEIVQ